MFMLDPYRGFAVYGGAGQYHWSPYTYSEETGGQISPEKSPPFGAPEKAVKAALLECTPSLGIDTPPLRVGQEFGLPYRYFW